MVFGPDWSSVPAVVPEGLPGVALSVALSNVEPVVGAPPPKKNCPLIVAVLNELSVCCWM
jgi:hypothetical protein